MHNIESILDVLIDIRKILESLTIPEVVVIPASGAIDPSNLVYERKASTLSNPVPPNASKYPLIDWREPENLGRVFYLVAVGSDQHDNSYYHWIVDDMELPISGEARVGSIYDPFVFPRPLIVRRHVKLLIDNNNTVPYPNATGSDVSDRIPYEGVIIGFWG